MDIKRYLHHFAKTHCERFLIFPKPNKLLLNNYPIHYFIRLLNHKTWIAAKIQRADGYLV